MIGYCGTGYHGMQLNPPNKTIEGELFEAFVKAGAISKNNSNDLKKNGFMRAARTDKGVHAAGNVISLKMIIEDPEIVAKINKELPEQIRIWGIQRTNKAFDCRKMCSSRIYEYLMPTYSFLPPRPGSVLANEIAKADKEFQGTTRDDEEGTKFWTTLLKKCEELGVTDNEIDQIYEANKLGLDLSIPLEQAAINFRKVSRECRGAFRISQERLELVRKALNIYVGSHNFHNFTNGKSYRDPSAKRYMKSFTVSEPFLMEGTEWISIKIHGQSFMLHQIRKMIGMAALVIRTGCPLSRIEEAFGETKINIPKAPALGLLLEQPVYDSYNNRLKEFGHDALGFAPYEEEMDKFKHAFIYDKIFKEEQQEHVFSGFFSFIDAFNGTNETTGVPIFQFLTARGIPGAPEKEQ
jgi:tRNA pseudouridine38-40 synthase